MTAKSAQHRQADSAKNDIYLQINERLSQLERDAAPIVKYVTVLFDFVGVLYTIYKNRPDQLKQLIKDLENDLVRKISCTINTGQGQLVISQCPNVYIEWKSLDMDTILYRAVYLGDVLIEAWRHAKNREEIARHAFNIAKDMLGAGSLDNAVAIYQTEVLVPISEQP